MREFPTQGDVAEAGPEKTIVYLRLPTGEQPAEDFLQELNTKDLAKMLALLRRMATHGIRNREQFDLVDTDGRIFAFKARALRLLCFHDKEQLILLVGGGRIDEKLPASLLRKANDLRADYERGKLKLQTPDRRQAG